MRLTSTAMLGLLATTALTSAAYINKARGLQLEDSHLSNAAERAQLEARDFLANKMQHPSETSRIVGAEAVPIHQLEARDPFELPKIMTLRPPGRTYMMNKPVDEHGNPRPLTPEEKKERERSLAFYGDMAISGVVLGMGVLSVKHLLNHNDSSKDKKVGKRALDNEDPHQLKVRDPMPSPGRLYLLHKPLGQDGKPRPLTPEEYAERHATLQTHGNHLKLASLGGMVAWVADKTLTRRDHEPIRKRADVESKAIHQLKARDPFKLLPGRPGRLFLVPGPKDAWGRRRPLTPEEKKERADSMLFFGSIGALSLGAAAVAQGFRALKNNEKSQDQPGPVRKRAVDTEAIHQIDARNTK